jgi:hypothetical protein
VLGAMLVLRLIWGLIGTRYARFGWLLLSPAAVGRYFRDVFTVRPTQYVGHNPASSWAIVLMYAAVAVIVATGVMMSAGFEAAEEVHELAAYALLAVAAVHVAGVLLHTVRQRENITLSMITGRMAAAPEAALRSSAPVPALLGLAIVVALGASLVLNYDPAARQTTLPLLSASIHLAEHHDKPHHEKKHHRASGQKKTMNDERRMMNENAGRSFRS